jgi:hypothetical protein
MAKRKVLKFGVFQYWRPTPVFLRKIGDTCLGVSSFLAVTDFEHPSRSVIILLTGIAGKVLTNLFSEN